MSQITTHILDTAVGKPAEGITVVLYQHQKNQDWNEITKSITDKDGRVPDLLSEDRVLPLGIYKIRFETKEYFDRQIVPTFYPYVEITFEIKNIEHYHIPLLLSPHGYCTYRGS